MSRAERRHHRDRLLVKRKDYFRARYRSDPEAVAKLVDTPTPCSCWMCRNPRTIEGPPVSELRQRSVDDVD